MSKRKPKAVCPICDNAVIGKRVKPVVLHPDLPVPLHEYCRLILVLRYGLRFNPDTKKIYSREEATRIQT